MGIFGNLFKGKPEEKPELTHTELKEKMAKSEEPWVTVVQVTFPDPQKPQEGYFELDWNDAFVAKLITHGYSGKSPDEVIEQWFNDICRGMLDEEI